MPTCPEHKLNLVVLPPRFGENLLACPLPGCHYLTLQSAVSRLHPQMGMALGQGQRKQRVIAESEAQVQDATKQRFLIHGYEVLDTSEHRRKVQCAVWQNGQRVGGCGRWFYPPGGRGTDEGIPDLFVRHPVRYPPYVWIGCEMKGSTTALSDAQRLLAARMGYVVARTAEDAWKGVLWAESFLLDSILRWQATRLPILLSLQNEATLTERDLVLQQRALLWQQHEAALALLEAELVALDAAEQLAGSGR